MVWRHLNTRSSTSERVLLMIGRFGPMKISLYALTRWIVQKTKDLKVSILKHERTKPYSMPKPKPKPNHKSIPNPNHNYNHNHNPKSNSKWPTRFQHSCRVHLWQKQARKSHGNILIVFSNIFCSLIGSFSHIINKFSINSFLLFYD